MQPNPVWLYNINKAPTDPFLFLYSASSFKDNHRLWEKANRNRENPQDPSVIVTP